MNGCNDDDDDSMYRFLATPLHPAQTVATMLGAASLPKLPKKLLGYGNAVAKSRYALIITHWDAFDISTC
jgi:hypothetical protein